MMTSGMLSNRILNNVTKLLSLALIIFINQSDLTSEKLNKIYTSQHTNLIHRDCFSNRVWQ